MAHRGPGREHVGGAGKVKSLSGFKAAVGKGSLGYDGLGRAQPEHMASTQPEAENLTWITEPPAVILPQSIHSDEMYITMSLLRSNHPTISIFELNVDTGS